MRGVAGVWWGEGVAGAGGRRGEVDEVRGYGKGERELCHNICSGTRFTELSLKPPRATHCYGRTTGEQLRFIKQHPKKIS